MSNENIGSALQEYESKIWSIADVLYENSFKQSEWPNLMMPFFALLLVESRLMRSIREMEKKIKEELDEEFDSNNEVHIESLDEEVLNLGYGYHAELIKSRRTIASLCDTQPHNFYNRFRDYLEGYDAKTKELLGVGYAEGTAKYLDLQGVIGALNSKNHDGSDILYEYTKAWSQVDLSIFNNSEVTTLEEHIKRKWADISAETAGQHYTPADIIELCTDINIAVSPINPDGSWEVYDMTCGGGNFLFGLEDSLRKTYPRLSLETYGQEYNDQLYALGAIEARFRPSARVEYGNTLTNDKFVGKSFGSVIGNPPYGTGWEAFKPSILKDTTRRFHQDKLPPISDSQTLFLQHAVSHMKANGVGTIIHNGSPLTSGDAGGGESNIRKYLLQELDVVQAIIQLPQNIFFNTGITTYVWVLNKKKPEHLIGKVLIINAENLSTKLKKSLNKKTNIVSQSDRQIIVELLKNTTDTDICKIMSVDDLMYNKVDIEVTRLDEEGQAVVENIKLDKHGKEVSTPVKLDICELTLYTQGQHTKITVQDGLIALDKSEKEGEDEFKQLIADAIGFEFISGQDTYHYDTEENIIEKNYKPLGKGVVNLKLVRFKKSDTHNFKLELSVGSLKEKDSEVIPYSSDKVENEQNIEAFLNKWVKEPYRILETKEGCEINFNKVFPKKVIMRSSADIFAEIEVLNKEFGEI